MKNSTYILLENRGVLRLSGPDQETFLQGLITQDLKTLQERPLIYTALLNPKGKYLFDFFIFSYQGCLYLEGDRAQLPSLQAHLLRFKLRSQVTIQEATPSFHILSVRAAGEEGLFFPDPRTPLLGYRWMVPAESPLLSRISLGPSEVYEKYRLSLGVPATPHDLVSEKSVILECGLDDLNAISWSKGCYTGQELMARTRYKGVIRKRLFPWEIPLEKFQTGLLTEGTPLFFQGEEVGAITSLLGCQGMAMIRLSAVAQSRATGIPVVIEKGVPLSIPQPTWWTFSEEEAALL